MNYFYYSKIYFCIYRLNGQIWQQNRLCGPLFVVFGRNISSRDQWHIRFITFVLKTIYKDNKMDNFYPTEYTLRCVATGEEFKDELQNCSNRYIYSFEELL